MKKITKENAAKKINNYFKNSKNITCPKSMKQNLYAKVFRNKNTWFSYKLAFAGVSLVFVTTVLFNVSYQHKVKTEQLKNAQIELQIAMHYINQVSLKSLSAVNNKGIKPALIKPLARSYASL